MKKFTLLFAGMICASGLLAQDPAGKVFWKQDFAEGKIPAGWQVFMNN
jgi:hypothetical protein